MDNLSIVNSLKSSIRNWLAAFMRKVGQNKVKFFAYLTIILLSSLATSRLLGESFSVNQIKYQGEPKRSVRQASGGGAQLQGAPSSNSLDPYAARPRIQTQNGHLIIQSSQDKNIDFKTSGARGSITINGFKLDQLIGVARAFEKSHALLHNDSLSNLDQHYELLVRSLFDSTRKLRHLEELNKMTRKQLAALQKQLDKLSGRFSKRLEKLNKLANEQTAIALKLSENNCLASDTGEPVCKNGATCIDLYDRFKCLCAAEWGGPTCEQDVDECVKFRGTELGCQNGAKCINLAGSFRCECPAQFHGVHCTEVHDDCTMSSSAAMCGHGKCLQLARTQPNEPAYECICDQGWTQGAGSRACIDDINECLAGQNVSSFESGAAGAAFQQARPSSAYPCSQNPFVDCINLPGSFQCGPCPAGYTGNGRLCRDLDECQTNNGGCSTSPMVECVNLAGSRRCGPCPPNYRGDGTKCERASSCSAQPNGGCHPMAKCIDIEGVATGELSRICSCQWPFIGLGVGPSGCAPPTGGAGLFMSPAVGGLQTLGEPAPANATGHVSGPLGDLLAQLTNVSMQTTLVQQQQQQQQQQDDCQPNPCLNGAQCLLADANFECVCPTKWTGRLCEQLADFACGGRMHASLGSFEFPVGGSFEQLIKLASGSPAKRLSGEPAAPTSSVAKYHCSWSIAVAGNMSLRLNFANLTTRRKAGAALKQIQISLFDAQSSRHGVQAPNCREFLDINERLDGALEAAAAKGRRLARLCAIATTNQALKAQSLSLTSDSNMVELEYWFAGERPLDEPALSFRLNWTKSEPSCGGELPVADSGSISSPRFPDFYPAGTECRYLLRVAPGRRIRIQFGELNLLTGRPAASGDPCADSLIILDGALNVGADRPVLFKHCANQLASRLSQLDAASSSASLAQPIISSSSTVELVLVSSADSSTPLMRPKQKRGFILTYASEPSTPGCGGLYTAKAALIRSLDYEKLPTDSISSGDPNEEALAYEYARYFERNQLDNSTNHVSSANRGWDSVLTNLKETSSSRGHGPKPLNSSKSEKSDVGPKRKQARIYRTRCEYEIRPADQARNHRIGLDWVEMPSELSSGSMGSLTGWSRRSRCMDSRLMVFDGNPAPGEAQQASESDLLLRTFCAGDRFNASLAHARPLASTGHVLYLIYESMSHSADDQATQGPDTFALSGAAAPRAKRATGFQLHYSTICSAVYRQLEGQIITELDADANECVYHILLPPNNTISLLVEPLAAGAAAADASSNPAASAGAIAALTLPDGSCAAQAIFIDGVVDRNSLSLAQAERHMRTYDFSGAYFGSGQADQTAEAGFNFAQRPNSAPLSGDTDEVAQQARATGRSPDASPASNSYWQYGTSQAHDIKEFDVCKLPALGIDSVWNHMSLMFRLNPKVGKQTADELATGATTNPAGRPFERVKLLIKYQAESSCGGVISEPRKGSIKLFSARSTGAISNYPLTVGRYEQLHRQLFVDQCAWILRNEPNQLIQLSFSQVPVREISERRAAWIGWLRKRRAFETKPASNDNEWPAEAGEWLGLPTLQTLSSQSKETATQRLGRLANCSQAFQEIIELYEPSANLTRFVCPSELIDSANFHWTTQSSTVYVRLINNTLTQANANQSSSGNKGADLNAFPGRKPLQGFPPTLNYEMLNARDTNCGGRLLQSAGMIQSPRFPFNYPPNLKCVWLIEAPSASQQIRLNFSKFHLEESAKCWFDFLEIRNGPSESSPPIGTFCGRELESRVLVTQSHAIWLKFRTDGHLSRPGFQLFFEAAQSGCGGLLSAAGAQIDSPNYPYAYAHGAHCEWSLQVSAANRISLEFEDLDLSGTKSVGQRLVDRVASEQAPKQESKCQTEGLNVDYLEVFDGPSARAAKSLGRLCHLSQLANVSRTLYSSSNNMRLVYRSQAQDSGRGFRLKYTTNCTFEQELSGVSGAIESPGFPGDLTNWAESTGCNWVIRAPIGANLTIVVTDLSLSDGLGGTNANKNRSSTKRPTAGADSQACSPLNDQLKFWSARVARPNATIAQQLEPVNRTLVGMFAYNQSLELKNGSMRTNGPLGVYDLTLAKTLCGQLDDLSPKERQLEFNSNLLIINLLNSGQSRELRHFRLEWRARGCGGLKRVMTGESMTEWLHFDERLNLTQKQLDQPLECVWLVDASHTKQLYEFVVNANMASGPATQLLPQSASAATKLADPCQDASLTFYDGADTKAPVLARSCNERLRESVYPTSGMLLVRYFSSGRLKGVGSSGRAFRLRGWLAGSGRESGCSHSTFDIATPFFQQAAQLNSPNYPGQYEARAYKCSNILTSTNSGRLRLTVQELDIPVSDGDASGDPPPSGLLDADTCRKSGNYLRLRASLESGQADFLCGKLERPTGVGVSRDGDGRGTFVLDSPSAWVEFVSRGNARGRWRLTYDRLCGSTLRPLMSAEEFTTPNYPQRPAWPSALSAQSPSQAENVCVWRLSASGSNAISRPWYQPSEESEQPPSKVHFNLFDFVESDRLASSPSDCLRVYEGANISLRQSAFNLTELDTKLEPKVKICTLKDLKFNSMHYVSAGSEIVILISGNAGAHFTVRPFENNCGAYFMQERGEFASPNYPQPYAPNLDCHYFLSGSAGSRMGLRFSEFDLGYARAAADVKSDENCADAAHVEVRQLEAGRRVQLAHKRMLNDHLYERATLDSLLQLAGFVGNATSKLTANETRRASRRRSLERLFQLASLYHVLEEAPARGYSWLHSERVRGRDQKLSIKLEEFYANSRLIGRFCGLQEPKIRANLLSDEVLLRFRTHSSAEMRLLSTGEKRNPRGFLANYQIMYGGKIDVDPSPPPADSSELFADLKLLSSPQYPLSRCLNDSIRWVFQTKPENVLEFELISLSLGSVHEPCQDSVNIYDGLGSEGSLPLAKLCGELSYRRLLDRSLAPLWQRSLEGKLSTRKLPVHLAHEPQVRLNLIRRIRTTMNQAVVEYRNFRSLGSFIMRYRALNRKASGQGDAEELANKPLEADEALDGWQLAPVSVDGVEEAPPTEGASKWCSRVHKLHLKTFGGHTTSWSEANATDRVDLLSPNWPKEVEQRELECHWLVRAQDNTNIRLAIEPSGGSLLAAAEAYHWSASYSGAAGTRCFKARERNFVEIHDGATNLAPLIGRFCLPAPPIQLQSTGQHLFIRYVHAQPPEVGADSKGRSLEQLEEGVGAGGGGGGGGGNGASADQEERPVEEEQRLGRSSLFKATASVGHCGGQHHVTGPMNLRDRPVDGELEWRNSQYENNLDCLFYVFAASLDQVLTLYPPTWSEFDFAPAPTNADCSVGDFVELRDLPLVNDRFDIAPAQASSGRLLGRFCAGRPLNESLETPGSGLVVRFHTDAANTGHGFNLFLSSETPRLACPRNTFHLTAEEPYARLLSPNWPLGFAGQRRCKFNLMAPKDYTIELHFVRLVRPMDSNADIAAGSSNELAPMQCVDSLAYLDDNQAHGAQIMDGPLKQLRTFAEGTLLRSLVREVGCVRQSRYSHLAVLRELTTANATGGPNVRRIGAELYWKLFDLSPRGLLATNYTIKTNSRNLLLEYNARNLQEGEGFVAVARIVELAAERKCGGSVNAQPGRNKLESARFGQKMNDSEAWVQCEWSLERDRPLDYFDSSFARNIFHLDANDSPLQRGQIRTAFLAIQALEVPGGPNKSSWSAFEENSASSTSVAQKCGLNRVTLSDITDTMQEVACGHLTDWPVARWRLVGYNMDVVRIRTRNLQYLVSDRTNEGHQMSSTSVKVHRGLRAFFYETSCPSAERLPGSTLRIRSHTEFATNGSLASYQPGICHWMLRLTAGHYELSVRRINLRPEAGSGPAAASGTDKQAAKVANGCDLEAEQDFLSVRESAYEGAPELARFCAHNQQEAAKHKFELNNTGELSILFVAGLAQLRQGRDKFADLAELEAVQQDLQKITGPTKQTATQQEPQYGFELELTRVRNVTLSPFCQRSSSYNIYQLFRNSERYHTYGDDYYGGTIKLNTLYPKSTHCEIDMALDDDFRFNLTFVNLFDMEQSGNCRADYVQLLDLLDDDHDDGESPSATTAAATTTTTKTSKRPPNQPIMTPGRAPTTSRPGPATSEFPSSTNKRMVYLQKERKFRLKSKQIGRWCGRSLPAGSFVSKSNKIRLVFHSNEQIEGKGFLVEWSAVPAPNSTESV